MIEIYQQKDLDFYPIVNRVLNEKLKLESIDKGYFEPPKDAYNPLRQQYDAQRILASFHNYNGSRVNLKLGLVEVDIYSHGMNFIFGLADPLIMAALVSTHRPSGNMMMQRLSKEVVHETGHLIGLSHCQEKTCVMHFSKTVKDTDVKTDSFCKNCRREIG